MNIALFGGTFDPPHVAHTSLVETLLDRKLFDQVWYLPVAIHQTQFAKTHMLGLKHRLAMLGLVLIPGTKIEEFEIHSHEPSHTHSTLRALSQHYPQHTFSFVMGSDQLGKLNLWNCDLDKQCFPRAADEFDYYVYPRAGFDVALPYSNLKVIENVEPMRLSSTEVRDKVRMGERITGLVSPEVDVYIEENNLYL